MLPACSNGKDRYNVTRMSFNTKSSFNTFFKKYGGRLTFGKGALS